MMAALSESSDAPAPPLVTITSNRVKWQPKLQQLESYKREKDQVGRAPPLATVAPRRDPGESAPSPCLREFLPTRLSEQG